MNVYQFITKHFDMPTANDFYSRYDRLDSDRKLRYRKFVEMRDVYEAIPGEAVSDQELRCALASIRYPAESILAHEVVLHFLEEKANRNN